MGQQPWWIRMPDVKGADWDATLKEFGRQVVDAVLDGKVDPISASRTELYVKRRGVEAPNYAILESDGPTDIEIHFTNSYTTKSINSSSIRTREIISNPSSNGPNIIGSFRV